MIHACSSVDISSLEISRHYCMLIGFMQGSLAVFRHASYFGAPEEARRSYIDFSMIVNLKMIIAFHVCNDKDFGHYFHDSMGSIGIASELPPLIIFDIYDLIRDSTEPGHTFANGCLFKTFCLPIAYYREYSSLPLSRRLANFGDSFRRSK